METIKRKILIIDDDNFLVDMYALKFIENNFEVHTAFNGAQALDKLKGGLSPNVMLIDVIMPEMDGFEMLTQINNEKICPSCVKVILSNKSQQADIDRGDELGVAGYIVKASSTPQEVINQVIDILGKKL